MVLLLLLLSNMLARLVLPETAHRHSAPSALLAPLQALRGAPNAHNVAGDPILLDWAKSNATIVLQVPNAF